MTSIGTENAADIAAADKKGIAVPSPIVEKQNALEGGERISIDDQEYLVPTEEERHTLRRVSGRLPWIAFTVAFVELCERFAYYGTTAIMVNFIQKPLPKGSTTGADPRSDGRPGALGAGQRASTGLTTFNRFWAYFIPLFAGYIADSKWGRFRTIQYSIIVATFGHIIMIIAALPQVIKNPNGALGCFSVGIIFFGLGVGGFKPNISPLMAEQLHVAPMHVQVLKSGERVIVDPGVTTQRMFMYFYMFINIGSIVGQITMVYTERYIGFWPAFLLPTVMFLLCPIVLFVFKKKYVLREPTGSVFGKALKLFSFASKQNHLSANPYTAIRAIHSDNFWDNAKPSRVENKPAWMTFDDAWVDEVGRGIKACTVFLFYPLFWLAYNQIDGNLVSQANTMELHGAPNDLINNMNPLGILIMIPILDHTVYPLLRKLKVPFTPLKRMCGGFFFACAGMIWAAVLQHYIYSKGACGKYMNTCDIPAAPINVWTQTGAYILIGLAEIMASITGLEYAYTKAPANMRSLVFGFYNFTSALSAALGQAFVGLSDDPLLVWLYTTVAIIAFVGGIVFWICFKHLDSQNEAMDLLPESKFKGKTLGNETKPVDVDEAERASVPPAKELQ